MLLQATAFRLQSAFPRPRVEYLRTSPAQSTTGYTYEANTEDDCIVSDFRTSNCATGPPFGKVMAANRAEIAVGLIPLCLHQTVRPRQHPARYLTTTGWQVRIMRAATELNMGTVGIFASEDRNSAHRWVSDESFILPPGTSPVASYLNIQAIIDIAKVPPPVSGVSVSKRRPFTQPAQPRALTLQSFGLNSRMIDLSALTPRASPSAGKPSGRNPPRLRLSLRVPGVRRGLRAERHYLHRPDRGKPSLLLRQDDSPRDGNRGGRVCGPGHRRRRHIHGASGEFRQGVP